MPLTDRQADLDDLLARCRSDNAKLAFGEAVACFRAGAYRACIVSTWTAIVFDYVGKLRELELAGNGDAKTILESFENARKNHDVSLSQKLEASVLDDATTRFELLTPIEREDLDRLRLDRHRCAHPSLLTLDDPYRPTAELARCHMRNAAEHLLSRPPVQGREAWARIWADIQSEFFPEVPDEAEERLRPRLSRARSSLVRRTIVELTKQLLGGSDEAAQPRFLAALRAVAKMHHEEAVHVLFEKLPSLAEQVPDSGLRQLLTYCNDVELAWGSLGLSAQGRLKTYVEKKSSVGVLAMAAKLDDLWGIVLQRLTSMTSDEVAELAIATQRSDCLDEVVRRFESKKQYTTFAALRKALRNESLSARWSATHQDRLVLALHSNRALREYMAFDSVTREVLAIHGASATARRDGWRDVHDDLVKRGLLAAAERVREVFPDFAAPTTTTPTGDEGTEPDSSVP